MVSLVAPLITAYKNAAYRLLETNTPLVCICVLALLAYLNATLQCIFVESVAVRIT